LYWFIVWIKQTGRLLHEGTKIFLCCHRIQLLGGDEHVIFPSHWNLLGVG
jgi:hypothetical protein